MPTPPPHVPQDPGNEVPRYTIDLNSDVGEGSPHDADVIPLVTSINVACGGHAGDRATMSAAVRLARAHGVAVGAHPGHADRAGFGRRELPITPAAAAQLVTEQVAAIADLAGDLLGHVKLHGGLYHQAARDQSLADAIAETLARDWPGLGLALPAGSLAVAVARHRGLTVIEEAFIDRAYADDGTLVPRTSPRCLIEDIDLAAARAVRLVRDGVVRSHRGRDFPLRADTLCVHGDGSNPAALLRAVREALHHAGISVRRPKPPHTT